MGRRQCLVGSHLEVHHEGEGSDARSKQGRRNMWEQDRGSSSVVGMDGPTTLVIDAGSCI
jgi:hypothetical protein